MFAIRVPKISNTIEKNNSILTLLGLLVPPNPLAQLCTGVSNTVSSLFPHGHVGPCHTILRSIQSMIHVAIVHGELWYTVSLCGKSFTLKTLLYQK